MAHLGLEQSQIVSYGAHWKSLFISRSNALDVES